MAGTRRRVVSPAAGSPLAASEAKVDDGSLGRWVAAMGENKVEFSLSRSKMSSGPSLRDHLVALGMKSAF
jgi:hypothetical protein